MKEKLKIDKRDYAFEQLPVLEAFELNGVYRAAEAAGKMTVERAALLRLLKSVSAIRADGQPIRLDTEAMIANHVAGLGALETIERKALEVNEIAPIRAQRGEGAEMVELIRDGIKEAQPLIAGFLNGFTKAIQQETEAEKKKNSQNNFSPVKKKEARR